MRVEDGLNEMSRNTMTYLDQVIDQLATNSKNYLERIEASEKQFETSMERFSQSVLNEFNYSKLYMEERLGKIENKLDGLIQQSFRYTNSNLDSMNSSLVEQLRGLLHRMSEFEERLSRGVNESNRNVAGQLNALRTESIDGIRAQLAAFRDEIRLVQQDMALVKRALGAETGQASASATSSRKYY